MRHKGLLAGLILVAILLIPRGAALGDPLVPDRPTGGALYGQVVPLYDDSRFEPWAYTFEGQQANIGGYIDIYFWLNQMLIAKAWSLKMALRVTEYAVTDDFATPLLAHASATMSALGGLLWSAEGAPLVVGGLAFIGLWILLLFLGGRVGRVWGLTGGTFLVLFTTGLILTNGPASVRNGLGLARGMAQQVFQVVDRATAEGSHTWGLLPRAGDAVWRTLVYEPWVTGELSTTARDRYRSSDGLDGGAFLGRSVIQRENICLYNDALGAELCPWWSVEYLPRRMLLAGWTLAATLVFAGALTLLAGGIIVSQLTVLLLLALAPVWLLVALWWPGSGVRLVTRLLERAFGALVNQGLLTATLGALLVLSAGATTTFSAMGWMWESIVLVCLAVLAFRYRRAWFEPVLAVQEYAGRSQGGLLRRGRALSGTQSRPAPPLGAASVAVTAEFPAFGAVEPLLNKAQGGVGEAAGVAELAVRQRPLATFHGEMEMLRQQLSSHWADGARPELTQQDRRTMETAPAGAHEHAAAGRNQRPETLRMPNQRPQP